MTKRFGMALEKAEGVVQAFDPGAPAPSGGGIPEPDDDLIVFSSGRTAYANRGIVGIDANLELYEGFDGGIDWPPFGQQRENSLTADDMRELADLAIARWQKFRASL